MSKSMKKRIICIQFFDCHFAREMEVVGHTLLKAIELDSNLYQKIKEDSSCLVRCVAAIILLRYSYTYDFAEEIAKDFCSMRHFYFEEAADRLVAQEIGTIQNDKLVIDFRQAEGQQVYVF
jgi:hypothetical protein